MKTFELRIELEDDASTDLNLAGGVGLRCDGAERAAGCAGDG